MDIAQLISGCKQGDRRAHKALFYRYAKQVMYVAYRYTHDVQLAEDAVQETYMNAFKYISSLQATSEGQLITWLKKIAARESIRILKKRKGSLLTSEDTAPEQSSDSNAIDLLHNDDILDLLDLLPPGYRNVLQLFAIEGFSHEEISGILDISVSTSRSQLTRARQLLRQRWNTKKEYHAKAR